MPFQKKVKHEHCDFHIWQLPGSLASTELYELWPTVSVCVCRCEKCDQFYPTKYLHTRHSLVHQEEKKVSCPVCQKAFKTPENLKVGRECSGWISDHCFAENAVINQYLKILTQCFFVNIFSLPFLRLDPDQSKQIVAPERNSAAMALDLDSHGSAFSFHSGSGSTRENI